MTLTITIKCNNAAFFDDDNSAPSVGPEVARILRDLAKQMQDDAEPLPGSCYHPKDVNGNNVGSALFSR